MVIPWPILTGEGISDNQDCAMWTLPNRHDSGGLIDISCLNSKGGEGGIICEYLYKG